MWDGTGLGDFFIHFENCGADYRNGCVPWEILSWIKKGSRIQSKPAMGRGNRTHTGQKAPVGRQVYSWETPTTFGIAVLGSMVRMERTLQEPLKHVLRKNVVFRLRFLTRTRP